MVGSQAGACVLKENVLKAASLLSSGKDLVHVKEDVNRFGFFFLSPECRQKM